MYEGVNTHDKFSIVEKYIAEPINEFETFFTLYTKVAQKGSAVYEIAKKKQEEQAAAVEPSTK